MRVTSLVVCLAILLGLSAPADTQAKAKGGWKRICGADGRSLQVIDLYFTKNACYATGRFADEPLAAFHVVKGVGSPLKDDAGAPFYPDRRTSFYADGRLIALHWTKPSAQAGPDAPADGLPSGPLYALNGSVAKPIFCNAKPLRLGTEEGELQYASSASCRDCPYFVAHSGATDESGKLEYSLLRLSGEEAAFVALPDGFPASHHVYCEEWEGRLMHASDDRIAVYDGEVSRVLKDSEGNVFLPGKNHEVKYFGSYFTVRRSGSEAELFHLREDKLFPVKMEKNCLVTSVFRVGKSVVAQGMDVTVERRTAVPGGNYAYGRLFELKDGKASLFKPTKGLKDGDPMKIYSSEESFLLSVQEGNDWKYFIVDERSSRALTLPPANAGTALWGVTLKGVTVLVNAGGSGKVVAIDKNGKAEAALDSDGQPLATTDWLICIPNTDGLYVFGRETSMSGPITSGPWFFPAP